MAPFNFYNIFRVISAEYLSKITFRGELLLLPSFYLNDFRVISNESLRDSSTVKSTNKQKSRDSTLPDLIMVVSWTDTETLATAKYELPFNHKQCGKTYKRKCIKTSADSLVPPSRQETIILIWFNENIKKKKTPDWACDQSWRWQATILSLRSHVI